MRRRALLQTLRSCVALVVAAGAAASEAPAVRIAIAPFEIVAPEGASTPDFALLLADRIATRGVARVVGPAELGGEPLAEPNAARVKGWAEAAQVRAVAVGRTTRIGSQLSVDVRLRDGASGAVVGTYVTEVANAEQLEAAVERLSGELIAATAALDPAPAPAEAPPPVSSAGAPAAPAPKAPKAGSPFALASDLDSDAPLSIHSDQMEAFQENGRRRLVFNRNVKVVQGAVTLTSNRLEAFYPANASQPERLVAQGNVRLVQRRAGEKPQSAHCDQATYDRSRDRLICSGNAELREGEDRVRGREIEFDLAKETVTVKGGASVLIHPEKSSAPGESGG